MKRTDSRGPATPGRSLSVVLAMGILVVGGLLIFSRQVDSLVVAQTGQYDASAVVCPTSCDGEAPPFPVYAALESGETLDELLEEVGLEYPDRSAIVGELAELLEIRKLRPGLEVTAYFEAEKPQQLQVLVQRKGRVFLDPTGDGWQSRWQPFVETVETRQVTGSIDGSLVAALSQQGAPMDVAYRMADVLRWDVDFNRDLRNGDQFQVIYEEVFLDGVRDRTGEVVGLAFWNRGRRLEAYRHEGGYYDAEGRPLQKMFLRSPLPFTRVTSRFSNRRFHPVLKTYRPHHGVDYGAPTGTPVRATADGVVEFAAWGKGSGRMVKIRHPNDYLTAYLHLSKFGSGISSGRRVRQGEVIGYVGSSGLATGPHLDYRVQLRGKWIDPLSIKSVPADPISPLALPAFLASRDSLRDRLSGDLPWDVAVPAGGDRLAVKPAESTSPGSTR